MRNPQFITGCNDHFDSCLTAEDMKLLTGIGLNAMKIPVYGAHVGLDETPFFLKKDKQPLFDFSQLDRRLELFLEYEVMPVICPHKGDSWCAGHIIDDLMYEDTRRYVEALVEHIHKRFGPVIYGFFETELAGVYLHRIHKLASYYYQHSQSFRDSYIKHLKDMYSDIGELNQAYGTNYTSFEQCPVPQLGKVPLEVHPRVARGSLSVTESREPEFSEDSTENIIYYDLKRIFSALSAERYNQIGEMIKEISPGSEYWGPCVQLEFMFDTRQIHSDTYLSAVGPTLCDLAKQPYIDCLHVDTYRETPFLAAAEWRIAAKAAQKYNKRLIISEVGGENGDKFIRALDGLLYGADNLRGAMIWDAKSNECNEEGFGILNMKGEPRPLWYEQAGKFFSILQKGAKFYQEYHKGDVEVYFPHYSLNVIQQGNASLKKTIQLMADFLEVGYKPEPIFDDEVARGEFSQLWIYSYYMTSEAIKFISRKTKDKKYVVWQYAAHSPGVARGKDAQQIWPQIFGFKVLPAGPRPMERCEALGSFFSPPELALCYPPFWDIDDPGENEAVARHSSLYGNKILGIKTREGSYWFDEYIGFKDYFGERHLVEISGLPKLTYEPAPFGHRQSAHYALGYFNQAGQLLIVAINLLRTADPIKITVRMIELSYDTKRAYRVENLSSGELVAERISPDSSGILSFPARIPGNEKYAFLISPIEQ